MGRRKRRLVKPPKKRLPKIFLCPACGERSINVHITNDMNIVEIKCSKCDIKQDILITRADQPIDVYCKFTDVFYKRNLVR